MAEFDEIDASVLGKLLLMQNVIASLPEASILPFVAEGLMDIGLVGRVEHFPASSPGNETDLQCELISNTGNYGRLHFYPLNQAGFLRYFDHIRNFLFMVVVILDERRHRGMVENYQRTLEAQVEERTRELVHRNDQLLAAQMATITAFSVLTAARDHETGNHIQRTRSYMRLLGNALCAHPRFEAQLDSNTVQLYANSAPLHDIGKVAIPDIILMKAGKLTPEEWEIMKQHCVIGRDTIIASARDLGEGDDAFLICAAEIAYSHHERWNGRGYPQGLVGDKIPLSARLMAVADVYDALISKRVYKKALTHAQALEEMRAEAGEHFDADILAAMLAHEEDFRQIALDLADPPSAEA